MFHLITFAAAAGAIALVFVAGRPGRLPVSERLIYRILQLAAWLENIGTAADAGLLRYRMERRVLRIEMASTSHREFQS